MIDAFTLQRIEALLDYMEACLFDDLVVDLHDARGALNYLESIVIEAGESTERIQRMRRGLEIVETKVLSFDQGHSA